MRGQLAAALQLLTDGDAFAAIVQGKRPRLPGPRRAPFPAGAGGSGGEGREDGPRADGRSADARGGGGEAAGAGGGSQNGFAA